jgi:hypothetical protein
MTRHVTAVAVPVRDDTATLADIVAAVDLTDHLPAGLVPVASPWAWRAVDDDDGGLWVTGLVPTAPAPDRGGHETANSRALAHRAAAVAAKAATELQRLAERIPS